MRDHLSVAQLRGRRLLTSRDRGPRTIFLECHAVQPVSGINQGHVEGGVREYAHHFLGVP